MTSKSNPARVNTGIHTLDDMLGGGLLPESITLISGRPGAGKSTLAMQFLIAGIRCGEPGVYLSLGEEKQNFYRNMLSHGWDLSRLEGEGRLYFESLRPDEFRNNIDGGCMTLEHLIRKMGARRLVLDTVTSYLLACDKGGDCGNQLRKLIDLIRKWGVTAVLTGEAVEGDCASRVEYSSDTIIRLCNRVDGFGGGGKTVEVEKMRGSRHSPEPHTFHIESGEGLVVLRKPIRRS